MDESEVFNRVQAATGEPAKHQGAFKIGRRTYEQQYADFYFVRLHTLKPSVLEQATKRWDQGDGRRAITYTPKVLNVEGNELTYIIGTLFIDAPAKASTLAEVSKEHWISDPKTEGVRYRGEGEEVHLEDESGRIHLVGKFVDQAMVASGVVAAVLGKETPSGEFEVIDMCFAGMAPQPPLPMVDEKYVALISGLNTTAECPVTLEMQVLAEYLCGNLGSSRDQMAESKIAQVVVAGNLLSIPPAPVGHAEDAKVNDRSPVQRMIEDLDEYLADIAATVPLTLMPGKRDPADISIPQQPLHPCMFAKSRMYSGFRSITNPGWLEVDGVTMLGSSGQNVDDLASYLTEEMASITSGGASGSTGSHCHLAAKSLQWRHIAPSAPDTLWCYPFTDHDPFILTETPHVYFVGNQEKFDTRLVEGDDGRQARVVMVPSFSETHTIVLLNLSNMACSTVKL
ncbi:hypothetical protein GQ54DRAFT_246234, partial [Martensiomyces pterosporus]